MKKICSKGHEFNKTSSCPICPICEKDKKQLGDLPKISAPARRALEKIGIKNLKDLSKYPKDELLNLHGFGPGSIPLLKKSLKLKGLDFK
jgi:hypothetical protein